MAHFQESCLGRKLRLTQKDAVIPLYVSRPRTHP